MGNSRSASFEIDHLPGESQPKKVKKSRERLSSNTDVDEQHLERPASLYASVYAESSTSDSSKESETMSTLSSASTADNIASFDQSKTSQSIIPEIVEPESPTSNEMRRRSKTWQPSHFDGFFSQILETIEHEAGKTSPASLRRNTTSSSQSSSKRWSGVFN